MLLQAILLFSAIIGGACIIYCITNAIGIYLKLRDQQNIPCTGTSNCPFLKEVYDDMDKEVWKCTKKTCSKRIDLYYDEMR